LKYSQRTLLSFGTSLYIVPFFLWYTCFSFKSNFDKIHWLFQHGRGVHCSEKSGCHNQNLWFYGYSAGVTCRIKYAYMDNICYSRVM
jgi:hypothetical protein